MNDAMLFLIAFLLGLVVIDVSHIRKEVERLTNKQEVVKNDKCKLSFTTNEVL